MKVKTPELRALKKAKKVLRFWYLVLLETEHMDDINHRKEFQSVLLTVENLEKKQREV